MSTQTPDPREPSDISQVQSEIAQLVAKYRIHVDIKMGYYDSVEGISLSVGDKEVAFIEYPGFCTWDCGDAGRIEASTGEDVTKRRKH